MFARSFQRLQLSRNVVQILARPLKEHINVPLERVSYNHLWHISIAGEAAKTAVTDLQREEVVRNHESRSLEVGA